MLLLFENFKVISHASEDGILKKKKAYFQSKKTHNFFEWAVVGIL